jgi:hypothetical protein
MKHLEHYTIEMILISHTRTSALSCLTYRQMGRGREDSEIQVSLRAPLFERDPL